MFIALDSLQHLILLINALPHPRNAAMVPHTVPRLVPESSREGQPSNSNTAHTLLGSANSEESGLPNALETN